MSNKSPYREVSWKIRNQGPMLPGFHKNILLWLDRELPPDESAGSILEAGCGAAVFSPHLARRANHLRAFDPSTAQISANCEAHPGISFFIQDPGDRLAAESKSFDAIWAAGTLAQIANPSFAMQEFYRVLQPGGRLLITVPYHGFLKNLLIALFRWDRHFAPDLPAIRFFTKKMITGLVHSTGFHDIRVETCGRDKPLRDFFIPSIILLSAKK